MKTMLHCTMTLYTARESKYRSVSLLALLDLHMTSIRLTRSSTFSSARASCFSAALQSKPC